MSTTDTSSITKYIVVNASNPKMSIGLVLLETQLVVKSVQLVLALPLIFRKVIGFEPHVYARKKNSI